jgi:hypothetical protein
MKAERRSVALMTNVTPTEAHQIREMLHRKKRTLSGWLREIAVKEVCQESAIEYEPVPDEIDLLDSIAQDIESSMATLQQTENEMRRAMYKLKETLWRLGKGR